MKPKTETTFPGNLQVNLLRYNGTYIGESLQMGFGKVNTFGFGAGLTKIEYEKQWLGFFPDNHKFGSTTLKAKSQYLSFPFSLTLVKTLGRRSHFRSPGNAFRSGLTIAYVPSFLTANNFVVTNHGAADSSSFFSAYDPAAREFQHSVTIGMCSQVFLFNNNLRLAVEPYLGTGNGHFKAKANASTFTYGVKFQLSIKLPKIRIERQMIQNSDEKKKLLEQKQKEIQEQLNKQP
ncbi:MAG: hypothetical protein V4635_09630 [Bacteroidota bacterium]